MFFVYTVNKHHEKRRISNLTFSRKGRMHAYPRGCDILRVIPYRTVYTYIRPPPRPDFSMVDMSTVGI